MKDKNVENVLIAWKDNEIKSPSRKIGIDIIEQIASIFAIGNFYYCLYDFQIQKMEYCSDGIKEVLGIEPEDFSVAKFFKILHPKDLIRMPSKEKISGHFFYNEIPKEEMLHYKTVYLMRLKHRSEGYRTILHQAIPINISEEGKVQQAIAVHTDITKFSIPYNHRVSFIGRNRPSYFAISSRGSYKINENHIKNNLTEREIEIIREISVGKNAEEIAKKFNLSHHTVNTHKKNILRKAECKNAAELVNKCLVEGVL